MRNFIPMFLVGLSAVAVSCAPTHPHHASTSQPIIKGRLVDGRDGSAIAKRSVKITVDNETFTHTTNPQGGWRVPLSKIHYNIGSEAKIQIDCPGYNHEQINWTKKNDPNKKALDAGVINLGTIRLEKR